MKVKVSTIAFSKNKLLVEDLLKHFPDAVVNDSGKRMNDGELIDYFADAEAARRHCQSAGGRPSTRYGKQHCRR